MPPSPLGNFPELAQAYASSFDRVGRQTQNAGNEYNTGVQAQAEQAQRKASLEAESQRLKDMTDPNKYQLRQKEDGGYDFFDPEGNQIDVATYTQRTGQRAADVLKDSQNPIDIQYVEDFNNLQGFFTALVNKDTKSIEAYKKQQPNLSKYEGAGGMDKLTQDFKKYYQRYYVTRQQDPNAWGTRPQQGTLVPSSQMVARAPQGGGGFEL